MNVVNIMWITFVRENVSQIFHVNSSNLKTIYFVCTFQKNLVNLLFCSHLGASI